MERKLYTCSFKGCSRKQPILSKGLCNYHRALQRGNKQKKVSTSNKHKQVLDAFYERHIGYLKMYPYSENSKIYISSPSRANVCHILPKRKQGGFPSLATDDDNIVYLTLQEHYTFDKLLDDRRFDMLVDVFSTLNIREKLQDLTDRCTERNKMYFQIKEFLNNKKDE